MIRAGWTSPQNRVKENPADAKKFDTLLRLSLTATNGLSLKKMRAAYMMQCLVDLVGYSSQNSMKPLWDSLRLSATVEKLQLMDACCISGPESFCGAWTVALESLLATGDVDVADVFSKCNIQPFTEAGKCLLVQAGGEGDEENEDEAPKINILSVESLLSFGSGKNVPPADVLEGLRYEVQKQLMLRARTARYRM